MNQIWERLLSYHSTESIQKKLEYCYRRLEYENSSGLSYDNCYRFVYFLKHGENFFSQAGQSPYAIQPMLLFYGISQLVKACLVVIDPLYPSTSSVLAHGVSSRKRKKQDYDFLKDEVKIQRNGLFSHVAERLFQLQPLDAEKYSMELLFKQIAEMHDVFLFHHSKNYYSKVTMINDHFLITDHISQLYHMSPRRLGEFIEERYTYKLNTNAESNHVLLRADNIKANYRCSPFLYHLEQNEFYLPTTRDTLLNMPEILVHYLLLYNLSMISRYETEWWYELLLGTSNDNYPFILRYLEIVKRKVPYFVLNFLEQNI